jgi:hypothetical protein
MKNCPTNSRGSRGKMAVKTRLAVIPSWLRSVPKQNRSTVPSPLTPELREFIDRAIVPVLLKRYLALTEAEKDLAGDASDTAHSVSSNAARKLRAVRL